MVDKLAKWERLVVDRVAMGKFVVERVGLGQVCG